MFIPSGPPSGPGTQAARRVCVARPKSPVVLFVLLVAAAAAAAADAPLTLEAAEALALDAEPGTDSHTARAAALTDRAAAAGEWPDPELRVGLANLPIESGGFATEGMTQGQLGLRQRIPPGDSLALASERFSRLADEQSFAAAARARDVLHAVRIAWLEAQYWERAATIVGSSRPLFADLLTVTRSLYSVGISTQQDVLRAELELSRLDERLLAIDENVARARAALGEWVGEAAARPLPPTLPALGAPPPLPALAEAVQTHPALAAAESRREAMQAAVGEAEERFRPGWALDLGYGYRDGRLPDGSPRSDFVSVSVTVDLPFLGRERRNRELSAALAERGAATADRERLGRQLESGLHGEYARYRSLGRRIALYRDTIVPQAEDRARAALSAYQSETADFADVMRGRIDVLNAQLELARLETERAQSRAALARLGGS